MADTSVPSHLPPRYAVLQGFLDDRLLLSAAVVCGLLIGYQLTVSLLQPSWIKPVTDWLRSALAWPQLLVVAWVAVQLRRTQKPGAAAAGCGALALLFYAVARTLWTIADVLVYPHGVPFPSFPDLFFILQYPWFLLSFALQSGRGGWLPGLRTVIDGTLWISAIAALLWYFALLPFVRQSGEPELAKHISMFYQVGDVILLYSLVLLFLRSRRTTSDLAISGCLGLAVVSLFVGDTWATLQLFRAPYTYRAGSAPDLFRFIAYLFFPLTALVQLRFTPTALPARPRARAERLTWEDMLAGVSFVSPSVAVAVASAVIIVHATVTMQRKEDVILPEVVGIALLLLATLRPAVMFLEQEQLRRERDAARAQEHALRLANERMEVFLGMVAHELRTPLTSLFGNVHLMARRLDALLRPDTSREDYARVARLLRTLVERSDRSLERMGRLVEDVLDETRLRQGRLKLRLALHDLTSVVGEAVEEQLVLNPERTIRWVAEASPVPVMADASRIEQVVTNYVSNALKFSRQDQAVEVCVRAEDGVARVSVHDEGVGIPLADQPHIWDRFYQAAAAEVQSGSQVGFGIGLYISKAIVEGHHGRVGVESTPGQGSTFWFTLPLASTPPEAGAGNPASPPWPDEHEREGKQGNQ